MATNFTSIDLKDFISFDELYSQVNNSIARLVEYSADYKNYELIDSVGNTLSFLQRIMTYQMKNEKSELK